MTSQSLSYLRPKLAATLIILDHQHTPFRILVGKRHQRHSFLPGKYVFPGGKVERQDAKIEAISELNPIISNRLTQKVSRPSPNRARAIALAALRETFEETGLVIGIKAQPKIVPNSDIWKRFFQCNIVPELSALHLIARAITPPGKTRRFDTYFLAIDAKYIADQIDGAVGADREFTDLVWVSLDQARELALPLITSLILNELELRIKQGFSPKLPVPFLFARYGKFCAQEL